MPRLTAKSLTQKQIDAMLAPAAGCTVMRDAEQRGLTLRIWPGGAKTWSFEYRSPITGKNARIKIETGSLKDARAIANDHRTAIGNGRDPQLDAKADLLARQIEHASNVTVAGALERYENAVVKGAAKAMSRKNRMVSLRKAVETFNDRPVGSLTRGDLMTRLDEIQAGRGPIARNRAQSEIRHWLGWCRDRELVKSIALDRVKKAVKEQDRARERVLTDDELKAMHAAIDDDTPFSDILRVLLHTALRRGEAASLQPRDLDFDAKTITVRGEVSKTRRPRVIPMADAIAPLLRRRANGLKRDQFIFGDGSDFSQPFSGWGKRVAALVKAMPEGEPWTLHDIRRTVATRLHEAGVDALTIEDLLGHLTGIRSGVAGVYNRAATLERQREALAGWSARLATLAGADRREGGNVVRLKAAKRA